jgi:hypothetical protein
LKPLTRIAKAVFTPLLNSPELEVEGKDEMKCPYCGNEHPDTALFCPIIGKDLSRKPVCPHCRREIDPAWRICAYCGRGITHISGSARFHPWVNTAWSWLNGEYKYAKWSAVGMFSLALLLIAAVLSVEPPPQTAAVLTPPGAERLARSATPAPTARPVFSPLPTQAPNSPLPTANFPSSTQPYQQWKVIAYDYRSENKGDGWTYAEVSLAFQYLGDHLPDGFELNTNISIETQEGKTYPAIAAGQSNKDYIRYEFATSPMKLKALRQIPPGFIFSQVTPNYDFTVYKIYFRVAEIAHPLRIVFSSMPEWTIDLSSISQTAPNFPGEPSKVAIEKITALAGLNVDEIRDRAVMRMEGSCKLKNQWGSIIVQLPYSIENKDRLDKVNFEGNLGSVAFIDPIGRFNWLNGNLPYQKEIGPGKTLYDQFEISFGYPENKNAGNLLGYLITYGKLAGTPAGYRVISLEDCTLITQ